MIDIHCHILPGIDDGPQTLEGSIEMCSIAAADGIRTVFATPHFAPGKYECPDVSLNVEKLQAEVDRRGLDLRILAGFDICVTPELPLLLRAHPKLTLNGTGRYFLAELPHEAVPAGWDRFLLALCAQGMTPILTHPERNRWFLEHPDALFPFVLGGGIVQLTAMSVTGENGREIREYCRFLLQRNLVHVIATDAHSADLRKPILSKATAATAEVVGKAASRKLVIDNPQAIVEGRPIEAPEPVMAAPRRRSLLRRVLDL